MSPLEPIQHTAPVANDIHWYVIALAITCGGALLTYGISATFERWEKEAELPTWFSIIGNLIGITLATVCGAVVGYLVWHWGLGLLCGTIGAWTSPWVVGLLTSIIKQRFNGSVNNECGDHKKKKKGKT